MADRKKENRTPRVCMARQEAQDLADVAERLSRVERRLEMLVNKMLVHGVPERTGGKPHGD